MLFRELQYVIAIAENNSISKAANELYIAQPSLSQFLKQYEEQLGVQLFERKNNGVIPTNAGNIYLKAAREIIYQYEKMLQSLTKMTETIKPRHVTFAIADQRGARLLPPLTLQFSKEHPDIILHVLELHSKNLHEAIVEGKADVAIDFTFFKKHRSINDVDYSPIAKEEVYLAINRKHPLLMYSQSRENSTRRWINLRTVCHEAFIQFNEGRRLRILGDKLFRKIGMEPKVLQYTDNISTAINMVEKNIAMAFIPHAYATISDNIEFLSIGRNGYFWGISIMTNNSRIKTHELNVFIDTLRSIILKKDHFLVQEPTLQQTDI